MKLIYSKYLKQKITQSTFIFSLTFQCLLLKNNYTMPVITLVRQKVDDHDALWEIHK